MLKIMTRNGMTCMSQSIMIQATTWLSFMHNATALCENMKDDYKMSDWLPVKRFVLKINFYRVDFITGSSGIKLAFIHKMLGVKSKSLGRVQIILDIFYSNQTQEYFLRYLRVRYEDIVERPIMEV